MACTETTVSIVLPWPAQKQLYLLYLHISTEVKENKDKYIKIKRFYPLFNTMSSRSIEGVNAKVHTQSQTVHYMEVKSCMLCPS
jgi:hypothetical protein